MCQIPKIAKSAKSLHPSINLDQVVYITKYHCIHRNATIKCSPEEKTGAAVSWAQVLLWAVIVD